MSVALVQKFSLQRGTERALVQILVVVGIFLLETKNAEEGKGSA